jgi:hypothetical protein
MNLSRTEILNKKFFYPKGLIKLNYTKHFLDRLKKRRVGIDCIPTLLRITEDNIHSGKTKNGKSLISVVVRLIYKKNLNMFICFNPFDGGAKTIWFEKK